MSIFSTIRRNKVFAIGVVGYTIILPLSYYGIMKYSDSRMETVNQEESLNKDHKAERNNLEFRVNDPEVYNHSNASSRKKSDKTKLILSGLGLAGLSLYTILALSPRKENKKR